MIILRNEIDHKFIIYYFITKVNILMYPKSHFYFLFKLIYVNLLLERDNPRSFGLYYFLLKET